MLKRAASYAGKKAVLVIACAIAVGAVAAAVFGNKGLYDVWKLRHDRDAMLAYNGAMEAENASLEEEIRLLKGDLRYIARVARKELGMIGRDEVLYKAAPGRLTADKPHANR